MALGRRVADMKIIYIPEVLDQFWVDYVLNFNDFATVKDLS
jgi:hypothetical protein